jgi:lysophospholipase L1-like esterase
MKPFKIFAFFLSILVILIAVILYFPPEGIRLPGKVKIHFYTADDIFHSRDTAGVDIRLILKGQELLTDSVITLLAKSTGDSKSSQAFPVNPDSLKNAITRIEYPQHDSTVLYTVFKAMRQLPASGQLIRIMHYGDSQIEDDRMTSLIRSRLQDKFGGSGAGLVPASQLYPYEYSMVQQSSDNWNRHLVYGPSDSMINHQRFGALANFCTLSSSSTLADTVTQTGWVSFRQSPYSYQNTRYFRQCRIFYGYNAEPFINEIFTGNQLIDAELIPASNKLKVIKWVFDNPVSNLMVQFRCKESPEIYGLALDNTTGIAVDNIPLRGCSGLIFTSIDEQLLRDMYRELNVKLFILQFGGNVVPYIADKYAYYEKWFFRQIVRIKELCPGAAVLVIGVADMAVKDRDNFVSYPNLEKVIDAVKSATFKAGAAFWDMNKAMGGMNSMPVWVNANPPLATKDYVHFTQKGSAVIAQMFYNAFIFEYHCYEETMKEHEALAASVY